MSSSAPQIGFDRFIQLDWIAAVVGVCAGNTTIGDLGKLLDAAGLGQEARVKTQTKLNAFGLRPREDLASFVYRGHRIVHDCSSREGLLPFAWGVAIATYPFFGKVSELTGRLTSLQGDCSVSEIHRRMSEIYGDREITKRAAQAVLQTQADWGIVKRLEKGRRMIRLASTTINSDEVTGWLIEAAIRYVQKPISAHTLPSLPSLYPFTLGQSLIYLVSKTPSLEIRSEGPSVQYVQLRVASK